MEIEIRLYVVDRCEVAEKLLAILYEEATAAGIEARNLKVWIRTFWDQETAEEASFCGSPTLVIGGREVCACEGQNCYGSRLYESEGQLSAMPDRKAIRTALEAAKGE